jgi:hypothetical protein
MLRERQRLAEKIAQCAEPETKGLPVPLAKRKDAYAIEEDFD